MCLHVEIDTQLQTWHPSSSQGIGAGVLTLPDSGIKWIPLNSCLDTVDGRNPAPIDR